MLNGPPGAATQPHPLVTKFQHNVHNSIKIKFSNYLEDQFQVDRKISMPEVSKLQKSMTSICDLQ